MPAARATGWRVSGTSRAHRYGCRLPNEPDAHTSARFAGTAERIAEMAGRQGSPYTGKLSARPAGKPGDFFIAKESLRRSLPRHRIPHQSRIILGAQYAFSKAWRNLSGPMGFTFQEPNSKPNPGSGPDRLPLVGPEPRQKNAPGGTRPFSSSADEFRPAIPRSGWSPPEPVSASPARTDYHALPACHLKTGTFYFAGKRNFLLCLDTPQGLTPDNASVPP